MKQQQFNDEYEVGNASSEVGMTVKKWDYPGIGYHLSKGKLYLDGEAVPELKVTVFAMSQWKNVTVGKMANKRVIGSYRVFEKRENMKVGEGVETRLQVVVRVNGKFYVFGTGSVNALGAWLKDERNKQYYAKDLPLGIWTQLQNHINVVKQKTQKSIPQFGWEFTIAPADYEIETGGEYNQTITPLIRTSGFKYVGDDVFRENEAIYLAENLDEWIETRSNPNGAVTTDDEGTHEASEETKETLPNNPIPPKETDEIPF